MNDEGLFMHGEVEMEFGQQKQAVDLVERDVWNLLQVIKSHCKILIADDLVII